MKNIKLIEVPSEIGAGTRGASMGVDAIKIAALDFMSNFFVHFPSEKIEVENNLLFEPIQSPYGKRIHGVLNLYEKVSKAVCDSIKSNFFRNACAIFIIGMSFPLCVKASVKAFVSGPGDTLSLANNHIGQSMPGQKSLIQGMSRDQLNSLIDLLMEMDTIPADLSKEIEIASEHFKLLDNNVLAERTLAGFPASDLYSSWEINQLFPEKDMLKFKGDTSVTIFSTLLPF